MTTPNTTGLPDYAHVDRCDRCRGKQYTEAFREERGKPGYYRAFYQCRRCGHEWSTAWANSHRMADWEVDELIAPEGGWNGETYHHPPSPPSLRLLQ